jgi:uncharacterized membrane protein
MDRMIRAPVSLPLLFLLIILIPILLFMLFVNVISISFVKLGLPPALAFFLIFGSLFGSFMNIPLTEFETEGDVVTYTPSKQFGWFFPQPNIERRTIKTVLAVNVGGAVIPIFISVYLIARFPQMFFPIVIGTVICVVVSYLFSRPVPGMGIAMPIFVAPVTAAVVAVGLSLVFPGAARTVLAYTCGVLGVLIGADILNLDEIRKLGAPTASIGGAGTFDGIFLTGILAVLLV